MLSVCRSLTRIGPFANTGPHWLLRGAESNGRPDLLWVLMITSAANRD